MEIVLGQIFLSKCLSQKHAAGTAIFAEGITWNTYLHSLRGGTMLHVSFSRPKSILCFADPSSQYRSYKGNMFLQVKVEQDQDQHGPIN